MPGDRRETPNPYAPPASDISVGQPGEPARKVVVYRYTLSVVFFTYYGHSEPVLVTPGKSGWQRALPYSLLSLLFGWWGLPWGPIRTIQALVVNLGGGQDVTAVRSKAIYGVEQPNAKWTCPECARSYPKTHFNCTCGYRHV